MSELKLHLFGSFRASQHDDNELAFHGRKAVALLVFLTSEATSHSRDSLIGLFWPDLPESSARNNLRVSLSRLTKSLGKQETPYLLANRQTIKLNPEAKLSLDTNEFTKLVEQTKNHNHESRESCPDCHEKLLKAADLYKASFLKGFYLEDCLVFEEWQHMQREHYHLEVLDLLADISSYLEQQGDAFKAEHYTKRQLKLEPLREDAHRNLMRLLAYQGKASAALKQYELCQQLLEAELGLSVSADTQLLYEQIKAGELKKETTSLGLPNELVSSTAKHNLPVQLTSFIGREEELEQLNQRLKAGERLLSIVGAGGIGKSRLALELAREQFETFEDAGLFVPLVGLRLAKDVPLAILQSLNIPASSQEGGVVAQLISILKTKHLLLVLDNLEHLMESIEFILELLQNTQHLVIVVTSRERLNLQAEDLFLLKGLPIPTKIQLDTLEQNTLSANASVRLFVERANKLDKQFKLHEDNLRSVGQICRLLEGIPLALELAATWVQDLECQEIADLIKTNVDLLQTQFRDVKPQHRSMKAVFDYSWQMLSVEEQQVLAKLSIFQGRFSLEAVKTILSTNLMMLSGLSHKSLLNMRSKRRYSMHELSRQFAAQKLSKLSENTESDLRTQHSIFYMSLLKTHEADLIGIEPRVIALSLQQDLDNIRAAWQWAYEYKDYETLLTGLAGLARFYDSIGNYQEGLERFQELIATLKDKELLPSPNNFDSDFDTGDLVLELLVHASNFAIKLNQIDLAEALTHRLIDLAENNNKSNFELQGKVRLGEVFHNLGRYKESHELLRSTLEHIQAAGLKALEGQCLIALGSSNRGNYEERLVYIQQALAIHQELGNRTLEQNALIKLSVDSCEQHDYDRYHQYSQQISRLSESVGHVYYTAQGFFLRGRLHSDMGQWQEAIMYHEKANTIFRQMGEGWLESFTLHNLCHVYTMTGQFDLAMTKGQNALAIAEQQNSQEAIYFAHTYLGFTYLAHNHTQTKQLDLARQSFQAASQGWHKLERSALKIENLAGLALTCLKQKDYANALLHIDTILDFLASGETLASTDLPLRIYWITYFVLAELNDVRAHQVLKLAYDQLEIHCSFISQVQLKQSFLTELPFNQSILKAWEAYQNQTQVA